MPLRSVLIFSMSCMYCILMSFIAAICSALRLMAPRTETNEGSAFSEYVCWSNSGSAQSVTQLKRNGSILCLCTFSALFRAARSQTHAHIQEEWDISGTYNVSFCPLGCHSPFLPSCKNLWRLRLCTSPKHIHVNACASTLCYDLNYRRAVKTRHLPSSRKATSMS